MRHHTRECNVNLGAPIEDCNCGRPDDGKGQCLAEIVSLEKQT